MWDTSKVLPNKKSVHNIFLLIIFKALSTSLYLYKASTGVLFLYRIDKSSNLLWRKYEETILLQISLSYHGTIPLGPVS